MLAETDGSTEQENAHSLLRLPPAATRGDPAGSRLSQKARKGRAVCGDKPPARFGERVTDDPAKGVRSLLYSSGASQL
jgi:hypothetical protein